jgi:hypothetical protein
MLRRLKIAGQMAANVSHPRGNYQMPMPGLREGFPPSTALLKSHAAS